MGASGGRLRGGGGAEDRNGGMDSRVGEGSQNGRTDETKSPTPWHARAGKARGRDDHLFSAAWMYPRTERGRREEDVAALANTMVASSVPLSGHFAGPDGPGVARSQRGGNEAWRSSIARLSAARPRLAGAVVNTPESHASHANAATSIMVPATKKGIDHSLRLKAYSRAKIVYSIGISLNVHYERRRAGF